MQCEHSSGCRHPRVDGSTFCARHADEADRIRSYRLNGRLAERFEHFRGSSIYDTAAQEIHLLRAMIEDRLMVDDSPAEAMNAFRTVTPQIVNLVKCIETLSKLERQNSLVLTKDSAGRLADRIVEILTGALADIPNSEPIVDRVASEIATAIAEAHNNE